MRRRERLTPFEQVARAMFVALLLAACAAAPSCKGEGGSSRPSTATSLDPAPGPEPPGDQPAFPFVDHVDQRAIERGAFGFTELFILGDELFEAAFNTLDGAGALALPDGSPLPGRFSRVPPGGGRFTGPNGQGCAGCHNAPFGTSAGTAEGNVFQDPAGAGQPPFNARNTISLFGAGLVQRLAEEMTDELGAIAGAAGQAASAGGPPVTRDLVAKGIHFGRFTATRDEGGRLLEDTSEIEGISSDLVVRPFGWKGNVPSIREFTRGAARNELGMDADELVAKDALERDDPDGDGVTGELSVGDITALVVYIAAQETPTTLDRLARDGLAPAPGPEFTAAARRGETLFAQIGCAVCHVPELRIADPIFEEPTIRGREAYVDISESVPVVGAGGPPPRNLPDPGRPFRFHLGRDGDFPRPRASGGGLRVRLFGDLKRHNMGSALADAQETEVSTANGGTIATTPDGPPEVVGRQEFLTAELWGVGNTGPWLHDGRAASLEEAILLHGVDAPPPIGDTARSEAQESRDAFAALSPEDRQAVVTFLRSLVLFELP